MASRIYTALSAIKVTLKTNISICIIIFVYSDNKDVYCNTIVEMCVSVRGIDK